jgi:hypothetical protein
VRDSVGAIVQQSTTLKVGNLYYLAPAANGGNDSNNGLSPSKPWLSPKHTLNCGDVILATPSAAYSQVSFEFGQWGAVNCSSGAAADVAWLKCAVFDACKLSSTNQNGMWITSSYWGVAGWEVTTSGTSAICFAAYPPTSAATIHHIVFANNIANGCQSNGFAMVNNGNAGVDYFTVVGNIAYNAAQSGAQCYSGISVYQPVQFDSLAGTHIYIGGNFAWHNIDANPCGWGGKPTDGEGIILDTFDGSQGKLPSPYAGQAVVSNNLLMGNGGRGLDVFNNTGSGTHSRIYLVNNTIWGDNGDTNQNSTYCGELMIGYASNVTVSSNIAMTNRATGCGANPIYAYYVGVGDGSDSITNNLGYSASGTNAGLNNSPGFAYGSNIFGVDPRFVNANSPGAPNCGSAANVPGCMQAVVAGFTAQASQAAGLGYQGPVAAPKLDALFPRWLCNTSLPSDLVTMGCLVGAP